MAIKIQGTDVVNDDRELKNITNADNIIQQPVNQLPANETTNIGASSKVLTLELSNYANLYGTQGEVQFQIADTSAPTYITETKIVTVANGLLYEGGGSTGNVFYIDGIENPPLTLKRGNTYIFDLSDASNDGHPLRFQTLDGTSYTEGVTVNGTPGTSGANVTFVVPLESPTSLEYYCNVHGIGMGGSITTEEVSGLFDDQNIVFSITEISSASNSYTISDIRNYLTESTTYAWRGRYIDSNSVTSLFSESTTFTVADTIVSVETPTITSPSNGATAVGETPTITSSAFSVIGATDTHASSDWQIATDASFTNVIFESLDDTSNLESFTVPSDTLLTDTQHYVRVRHTGTTYGDSTYSDPIAFSTSATFASIDTPTITSPSNGATDIGETPTITSSAFSVTGGSDTHVSSDWQIATDTSFNSIVVESLNSTANLESFTVPSDILNTSTTYYVRVRHTGSSIGDSSYSSTVSFTTSNEYIVEASFTTPGTYSWTAPNGVNSVSVVCVGPSGKDSSSAGAQYGTAGGGLGWKNNISVTSGQSYTVVVGNFGDEDSYFISPTTVKGGGPISTRGSDSLGGFFVGDGGGNGGDAPGYLSGGGGGAGGYSGKGGDAGSTTSTGDGEAGTGGAGEIGRASCRERVFRAV